MKRAALATTKLLSETWELGSLGNVTLVAPTSDDVFAAQASWAPLRRDEECTTAWHWPRIRHDAWETFALHATSTSEIVVLAASFARRLVQLTAGRCYRLDRLEVHPERRGRGVGALMLSILAGRAIEAGADGIVLASVPGAVEYYSRLGGIAGTIQGWYVSKGLTPFLFPKTALHSMWESIDG